MRFNPNKRFLDRIGAQRRKTASGSPKGEQSESIDRIGAQRRKTAVGSPKGERSESINNIPLSHWSKGRKSSGHIKCFPTYS